MQTLTVRELIDGNRAAIQNNRLAALFPASMHDNDCLYSYEQEPGVGCAIGVCMTPDTRFQVNMEKQNWNSLAGLSARNLIGFDSEQTYQLAAVLQNLHDAWLGGDSIKCFDSQPDDLPSQAWDFVTTNRGKPVHRAMFESYLDLLEQFA